MIEINLNQNTEHVATYNRYAMMIGIHALSVADPESVPWVSQTKTFPVFADQTPSTKVLFLENLIWMFGSIVEAPIRESKIVKSFMKANARKF